MTSAVRVRVEGTVQGVGFRPYVFRLAHELALGGYVLNDERGVLVEVEGDERAVASFVERLPIEAPPLAHVERIASERVAPSGTLSFAIAASVRSGLPDAPVTPDSATCDDCLSELFDPADRRYRYPFVNCTNCGPRFTIVRGVPYDRPSTTMAGFRMCRRCQAEYDDPLDRRFHAQPNACADCGPRVTLTDGGGAPVAHGDEGLAGACDALAGGAIVAVKGLGGFHLACMAGDERAVALLRVRKHREERPFALMVASLGRARELIAATPAEEAALASRERPIVVARARAGAGVAATVAPRSADLGVMLPYSPLHHLLLDGVGRPLVMTSGNVSDEPIAYEDDDALARLGGIADMFLLHDRPIHMRTDDSVLRGRVIVRRSRGYVPAGAPLPAEARRHVLACGAELKSTFCVARGSRAWVSHHIGDLQNYETLRSFETGVEHFERLFAVAPEVVAHDLHPDYLSTRYAQGREGVELVGVQHHHAHLAACLAEHGERGPAVGAIYDGTGYGLDGTVWGGELLVGGLDGFERAGHLWPARLPGGEQAVRGPWRMARAWLHEAGVDAPAPGGVEADVWSAVGRMVETGLGAPVTTSAGRLFDAVSALCGVRIHVSHEAQAAVELEAVADPREPGAYPMPLEAGLVLDARETIAAVVRDVAAGESPARVAMRFHRGLAEATAAACAAAAEAHGITLVVLSGGVFQNRLLLELTSDALERKRLRVLVPERLPPGDGGISYGQAAIAAALG